MGELCTYRTSRNTSCRCTSRIIGDYDYGVIYGIAKTDGKHDEPRNFNWSSSTAHQLSKAVQFACPWRKFVSALGTIESDILWLPGYVLHKTIRHFGRLFQCQVKTGDWHVSGFFIGTNILRKKWSLTISNFEWANGFKRKNIHTRLYVDRYPCICGLD